MRPSENHAAAVRKAVAALTPDELDARVDEIAGDLVIIKSQIEGAKVGIEKYSDHDREWLHKAKFALAMKGYEHQLVLKARARLKREALAEQQNRFERAFINAAKEVLSYDTFNEIKHRAELGG